MRIVLSVLSVSWLVVAGTARAEGPTFNKDVAPILWKNCAGCHRPGEVGPFPLLTYNDAAKRADFLQELTGSRRMPPWKPEPGFGTFHDARTLSEAEIKTIADWSEAGAPEGDSRDKGSPPRFPEGWQLGTPDLVLKPSESFDVPADGKDIYRCFVLPIPIDSDRTVAAVEFRPGNRRVVHHALLYLDSSGAARRKDESEPGPGYTSFGGPGILPTGGLGGWAPGAMPRMLPEGVGKFVRKGSDLVLQIHYHPDGKPESDQSVVGIYFTKTPAKTIVGGIAVRTRELKIPAGESRHHVTAQSAPLPVEAKVLGIAPHMHYIGKEMKVVAESPDGKSTPLIWIKDWDFNWQGQYQFQVPVTLAKGTVIKLDAYYDNSAENLRNPSKPPKPVNWGEQTTDEMCLLGVQVIANSTADLLQIMAMRGNGLGAALMGGPAAPASADTGRSGVAMLKGIAGQGFMIPDQYKDRLAIFDTNSDGRLSRAEIEAMPEGPRERVIQALRQRLEAGGAGKSDKP